MNTAARWIGARCAKLLAAALALTLSTSAGAMVAVGWGLTLSPDGVLVVDTNQGLTWLADTNYARHNNQVPAGRDPQSWDGRMTWDEATAWAQSLVVRSGGVDYTGWRLPNRAEMAYLYEAQFISINTPGPFSVERFSALAFGDAWSSEAVDASRAYYMDMQDFFIANGYTAEKTYQALTWGAVLVAEPREYAMLLAGLALVILVHRRKLAA